MHNTFYFSLNLEEVENWATVLDATTMVIGSNNVEFWCYFEFVIISEIRCAEFFFNIHTSKMRIFVNVYLDLQFQDHLLQELDSQTHCDYNVENMMKIGRTVSDICNGD